MVTELTDEQRAINVAGIARCRGIVDAIVADRALPEDEPQRPLTESEVIHQRAVERAISERRNSRFDFTMGVVA